MARVENGLLSFNVVKPELARQLPIRVGRTCQPGKLGH